MAGVPNTYLVFRHGSVMCKASELYTTPVILHRYRGSVVACYVVPEVCLWGYVTMFTQLDRLYILEWEDDSDW